MAISKGSLGSFRHSRQNVSRIKSASGTINEYQVGPANVKLDGSNYKGAQGASFVGIRKAINAARTKKVQVAVLVRRESGNIKKPKFRWLQTSTRSKQGLLNALTYAEQNHFTTADFAESLLAVDYPIRLALTWRIIEVYD